MQKRRPIKLKIPKEDFWYNSRYVAAMALCLWKRLEPELWQPKAKTSVTKDIQSSIPDVKNVKNSERRDTERVKR